MEDQQGGKDHHNFTDEELDKVLYLWDERASFAVYEYLYMKTEWRLSNGIESQEESRSANKESNLKRAESKDTGVDSSGEKTVVYLDLNTETTVHVVEFYAPWCPHCQHFKSEYIELAREIARRSLGITVEFHAVSCELFGEICRAYGIKSFPVIWGYPIDSNIQDKGIELNPVDGPEMTAESIANDLELSLAIESKGNLTARSFNNSDDRRAYEKHQLKKSKESAKRKRSWQSYPSSIDERYHNAAVSLVFVLKHSVYIEKEDRLDDMRALALKEFLELLDWTTPQAWHVRTGMIRQLLKNFPQIISGSANLNKIIDKHVAVDTKSELWGGFNNWASQPSALNPSTTVLRNNTKWTEACSHSERALGFTCGLWNLFHISTIGSSLPEHQLYGFLSGYLTSPADVAEILKRFIDHFFGCEVCRRNFLENYDNCGQNHCDRLSISMPALEEDGVLKWETQVELGRWFLEMHNMVNIRLMDENAERENRRATQDERLSAIFPPSDLCRDCWLDEDMTVYDPPKIVGFLSQWYWPSEEPANEFFQMTLGRNLRRINKQEEPRPQQTYYVLVFVAVGLLFSLLSRWYCLKVRSRTRSIRKSM